MWLVVGIPHYVLGMDPKIRKRQNFRHNFNGSVTGYVLLGIPEIFGEATYLVTTHN
jgi:hypothetical protein